MGDEREKTVVSGPPETPVALLDQLRKSLEAPSARSHQSVSKFVLGHLESSGVTTADIAAVAEELQDEKAGPYELDRVIATGGMGAVISAVDQNLRRDVAIKVILNGADAKTELVQRLVTEARITGQLEHPNIVPLHELGVTEDGIVYYTMRLVDGITLNEVLQKLRTGDPDMLAEYPLRVLLTVFQKVCDAVAYAHSRGVVHRDLKPDNIMLGEFGEVMVMDWGLAKVLEPAADEMDSTADATAAVPINDDTYQTLAGHVKGTPRYMAPEQALGHSTEIDERTDIYALGAILYGILTLHPPVAGGSVDEVLKHVATGAIAAPTEFNSHSSTVILAAAGEDNGGEIRSPMLDHCPDRRIPASLSAVAMKALARLKHNRYETVAELQKEIEAYQTGFATSAESAGALRLLWLLLRRNRTESILVSAALITIVALVAWFTSQVTSALTELKEAAPSFYIEARTLTDEIKFAKALSRINYALQLRPEEPRFHALKGNLHQSLRQYGQAVNAYQTAFEIDPTLPYLKENLDLSKRLAQARRLNDTVSTNLLIELKQAMERQRRNSESIALNTRLTRSAEDAFLSWRALVFRAGLRGRLQQVGRGKLSLKIANPEASGLDSIRDMPLVELDASNTLIDDLSPISELPLTHLSLVNTKVTDLNPLRGMELTSLALAGTEISDISILTNLPLIELRLDDCPAISDLSPLTALTDLKRLTLPAGAVTAELLDQLPGLQKIGTTWPTNRWRDVPTVAEFRANHLPPAAAPAPPDN